MLSAFSDTDVLFSFISADNTDYSVNVPIYVIDGDVLGIFPTGTIYLDEKNTTTRRLIVTGTDQPLTITGSVSGFSYTNDGNFIDLLPISGNTSGSTLNIESFYNGNTKTTYAHVAVRPFPLSVNSKLKIIEVGKSHTFLVQQIIGKLTLEAEGNTIDTFSHNIVYNRDTYSALVTITPFNQMSNIGTIKIIDTVTDRAPRVVRTKVKFVVDLDLTVITNNVVALDIPFKIRFENAEGALKFMAVSKLTGYSIRTEIEYDINNYNGKVDKTAGYLFVYPIAKDNIILRVADSRRFEDVDLTSLHNDNDFSKWVAVIPTSIEQQDLTNNLNSPADYSDTNIKAGDFVGNTWIYGYKYGIHQINKITYKVSPPESIRDNSEESLNWMRNLTGATHTLNISIRDGFVLDDINKNFTVESNWIADNIFETDDLTSLGIITTDAQTVLIADETDRISVTIGAENTGVIIYNIDGDENVSSRIDYEPISYIEITPISPAKKIPMNKPSNCYDIKRMDSSAVDGEFKIFPSTKSDDSIDVLCEFSKNEDGSDEVWTVIPEKSIRNFAEIVGKVVGAGNIELDIISNGGIHPEFYPSAYDSNDSLSYLFLELPYKVKAFSYTLDTREVDEDSAGTFKILTDTSDIFHINGAAFANSMLTRQGSTLEYNPLLSASNLGQVVSLPEGMEDYEYIENANGGTITPTEPSDRLILMNSGTTNPYTLSETFLKELRFNSIYNAENISTNYWVDGSSSGIDFVNIVTLYTDPSGRWIISDKEVVTFNIPQKATLLADTTWLISNTSSEVIEMAEFVKVLPVETVYNISDSQTTLTDLSEFVKVNPDEVTYIISDDTAETIEATTDTDLYPNDVNYIISDIEPSTIETTTETVLYPKDFIANISHITDEIVQFETNDITARGNILEDINSDYHLYNISLNDDLSTVSELGTNNITHDLNIREIVETLPHVYNVSFVDDTIVELSANRIVALSNVRTDVDTLYHDYNISEIDGGLLDLAEFVRMSVYDHDKVVSVVIEDETVAEVPTSVALTYDIAEVITNLDAYAYNINEFVTLTPNLPHDLVVSYVENEILEIQTRSHFDSYHPVNRLWRDATPMDISSNDINSYMTQERSDIINPISHQIIELVSNINGCLNVQGHNPPHPEYIFQDGVVADAYNDTTDINFINLEYTGLETDIINQHNSALVAIDFFNTEFIKVENDVLTQGNYDTTMLVDMRNLTCVGSESDIINQYFTNDTENTVTVNADTEALHLLANEPKTILQKTYKDLELVTVTREDWTLQDMFNKWPRINGASYFENGLVATGQANDWYMSGNTIIMPANTAGLNAFISPYKHENYTLESRLYSSNRDDDTIGLVAAHERIGNDNYTLSVDRTKGGFLAAKKGLGFVFTINNTQHQLSNISVNGTSGGWSGRWSKLKVVREGNIFKVWAGNWNSWSYSTTEPVMTIDLADYPEMEMLMGAKSYGYLTWSQADTRYYDNVFVGCSGAGADAEIKTIEGEWVDFISDTEYPTFADHVTIRSTEEIEFNLTFKEKMVSTPIDFVNMDFIGFNNDIIEQQNFDTVMPIPMTNLVYTGLESYISSQVECNTTIESSFTNMAFNGGPNNNIVSQHSSKAFMIDANPTIVSDDFDRVYITTQKEMSIMAIGEQSLTVRDNTNIITQKAPSFVCELEDTLRFHLPTQYKENVTVTVTSDECTSDNNTASIVYTFTEDNIRETEVLDFVITGEVDNVSINTYKGSNIEAVETVSIV